MELTETFVLPNQFFTTLNEQPDTTGKLFHFVAKDVGLLTRFDLWLENLRAQTYYGATMSGEYNGCQKLIGDQPMTFFVLPPLLSPLHKPCC